MVWGMALSKQVAEMVKHNHMGVVVSECIWDLVWAGFEGNPRGAAHFGGSPNFETTSVGSKMPLEVVHVAGEYIKYQVDNIKFARSTSIFVLASKLWF